MTTYNTNLASEFYVLSMLYRLGIDASLTLGNKKAVDIVVACDNGAGLTIEVKGLEGRYDWPADNIHKLEGSQHFYVLVCFEGKISDPLIQPSVWIIPAGELGPFIRKYQTRTVISRAAIKSKGQHFLNAWSLFHSQNSDNSMTDS